MTKKLIIMGAGSPEILRIINDINDYNKEDKIDVIGIVDSDKSKTGKIFFGIPILGTTEILKQDNFKDCYVICNVAKNAIIRKDAVKQLEKCKLPFLSIIHPTVNTKYAKIGNGVIIQEGVILQYNVTIEDHCIICSNAVISHEDVIHKYSFIGIGCMIAGCVNIGEAVTVWTNSSVIPKINIGDGAVIGINSGVLRDVEPGTTVAVNSARVIHKKDI